MASPSASFRCARLTSLPAACVAPVERLSFRDGKTSPTLLPMMLALSKTTILVVEDDEGLRRLYRATLSAAGYAVVAVADGIDALRYVDLVRAPDAVVLDLQLPR